LSQKPNVESYFESELDAESILEFGFENVCIATGAKWRRDGVSRQHVVPFSTDDATPIFTPDDLMNGANPMGHVGIYDDDQYYMGGVLAELLIQKGCSVILVTPAAYVSEWTLNTLEQHEIHRRSATMRVKIELNRGITVICEDYVRTNCMFTDMTRPVSCGAVLLVSSRLQNKSVFNDLKLRKAEWADAGIKSVRLIGDANAPGPIAWATCAGHRYARELDEEDIGDARPFRREITELAVN